MIDLKAIEAELEHARQARADVLAANTDVEDMIWQVQHLDSAPPRFVFFISGFEQTPAEV